MNENVSFAEDFTLGPNYTTVYRTKLTKKSVIYETKSGKLAGEIFLDDVIGAKVTHGTTNEEQTFFHIYSYPLKKKRFSKRARRHRVEHVFCVSSSQDFNENNAVAEKWVKSIRWSLTTDESKTECCREEQGHPIRLKFLVIVNPFGGQGSAEKMFRKKVKPMLDEADVDYELRITEHSGHAKEIALSMDGGKLDCILCCSGDGLIHEVMNGLMSRPDWKQAIKTPFGHIPCGSGNGLCAAALHHAGEPFNITSSVFTVLRGCPVPLDIVKAETSNSAIHYSFLGILQGIVADIDIDSEKYRYMGEMRFSLMALKKIMRRQHFTGKVWYLPLDDYDHTDRMEEVPCSSNHEVKVNSHQLCEDETASASSVTVTEQPVKNGICESHLDNVHLPSMQNPIPGTWKSIEGTFINLSFVTLSHIGKDVYFIPGAEFGNGVIYCLYLTEETTRKNLLDIMAKLENGEHLNINGVGIVKARAFRFQPYQSSTKNITIDGELVEYGNVQAEVYQGLGRVRCRSKINVNK